MKQNLKAFAWMTGAVILGGAIVLIGAHFAKPLIKGSAHVGVSAGAAGKKVAATVSTGAEKTGKGEVSETE